MGAAGRHAAYPEYPAAHGSGAGTVVEALKGFFGTNKMKMTFTGTVVGTVPHVFTRTQELGDESIDARVHGGMRFPTTHC